MSSCKYLSICFDKKFIIDSEIVLYTKKLVLIKVTNYLKRSLAHV